MPAEHRRLRHSHRQRNESRGVVLGGILNTTWDVFLNLLRETFQPLLFPDTIISREVLPVRHPLSIPLCGGYDSCL